MVSTNSLMKIKYRKVLPVFVLSTSALGLYDYLLGGPGTLTLIALVFLPISILMLSRPVAVLTPEEIQLKNLLGMTLKTYTYTPSEVSFKGKAIYVGDKKVFTCSSLFYPAASDVRAFLCRSSGQ